MHSQEAFGAVLYTVHFPKELDGGQGGGLSIELASTGPKGTKRANIGPFGPFGSFYHPQGENKHRFGQFWSILTILTILARTAQNGPIRCLISFVACKNTKRAVLSPFGQF